MKAPDIPKSVTNMMYTFANCNNLTGDIVINANPTEYTGCFRYVYFNSQNITLSGTSTMLEELRATGDN